MPHAMEQTVRARALIALAPTAHDFPEPDTRTLGGWTQLRPDQLLDTLRRRAQTQEETSLDCRMAASVSDEAVAATHVAMALETVALLEDEVSADDAIMHYVRYFDLPSVEAQIIFRRTLAAWAERHPVREPLGATASVCATAPAVPFTHRVPLTLAYRGLTRGGAAASAGYIFRRRPHAAGSGGRCRHAVVVLRSADRRHRGEDPRDLLPAAGVDRVHRLSGREGRPPRSATRCSSSASSSASFSTSSATSGWPGASASGRRT